MNKIIVAVLHVLMIFFFTKTANSFPADVFDGAYSLCTNKAVYKPGEVVWLKINHKASSAFIRYRHLNKVLKQEPLLKSDWSWVPPPADYQGYLVEVYTVKNKQKIILASVAVDVSSSWNKFPRYGFLSEFGVKSPEEMDSVISYLTRHHINGIQFYDWHDKHHQPLAGSSAAPSATWKDIADRECSRETVLGYINRAHQKAMQAMFYNLCYGALDDAAQDGVNNRWYMYRDSLHVKKDMFDLPQPPFKSKIWFVDPSDSSWQQYLSAKNNDVYKAYPFDGFHIDQVGNRDGKLYRYNGAELDLAGSFRSFITAMKKARPDKKLVFNAVNQYGQEGSIAVSPVEFLYTEVWTPNDGYKDLAATILNNDIYSNGKSSVLAAYMNYQNASGKGYFNTAGVLLANAVIFAFGGSHLELGEHMLCKEYFPNNNLAMNNELKKNITAYYDFLTAYQNLLRDGGMFNNPDVVCANGKMNINMWPPKAGRVAVQGKLVGKKQVLHFINFSDDPDLEWRDNKGTKKEPLEIVGAGIELKFVSRVKNVWVVSPDFNAGVPQNLKFQQSGNSLKFTLPALKYWSMIVIE